MEHKTPCQTETRRLEPMDALIRDGVRRGRFLHGQAIRAAFRALAGGIVRVARRARTRRDLRELDERLLRDIGCDRHAAIRESQKPSWRV